MGELKAPFPYFGGKSKVAGVVWGAFGAVKNYVEPFCGSAAMLLSAPPGGRVETINDFDGFVSNFWRSVAHDPGGVAFWSDWPCNEADLESRHAWLVSRKEKLRWLLEDPDFFDPKIAGWWCWGMCNWIGSGWCSGNGPHKTTGAELYDSRKLPHLSAGRGIKRQLPHLSAGRGIKRKLPHLSAGRGIKRSEFIRQWMHDLHERLRDVRVACGDWRRVLSGSVTDRHGLTGIFLDPPYSTGKMDYADGGVGTGIDADVREWCAENGGNKNLRIALCGYAKDHDQLLSAGWSEYKWKAKVGYAKTAEAKANASSEVIWFSPGCIRPGDGDLLELSGDQ